MFLFLFLDEKKNPKIKEFGLGLSLRDNVRLCEMLCRTLSCLCECYMRQIDKIKNNNKKKKKNATKLKVKRVNKNNIHVM